MHSKSASLHFRLRLRRIKLAFIPCALCLIALPAWADTQLYTNGPLTGSTGAWGLGFPVTVEDSFSVSSSATLTSLQFYVWAIPGYTLTSIKWGIAMMPEDYSAPNTGIASGTFMGTIGSDNMYEETITLFGTYAPGTYYLNLSDAAAAPESAPLSGNSMYWDENDGPSIAFDTAYGGSLAPYSHSGQPNQGTGTGSEAFAIYGTPSASPVPEPSGTFEVGLFVLAIGWIFDQRRRRKLRRA